MNPVENVSQKTCFDAVSQSKFYRGGSFGMLCNIFLHGAFLGVPDCGGHRKTLLWQSFLIAAVFFA